MASNELRQLLATPPQPSEGQPATALPTDPRQIAFLALQRLRESGDPSFLFLRTLIELASSGPAGVSGANEELAFHCAGGTRHVLLHRWATYTKEFRDATRDWLASLGMGISAQHPGAAQVGDEVRRGGLHRQRHAVQARCLRRCRRQGRQGQVRCGFRRLFFGGG